MSAPEPSKLIQLLVVPVLFYIGVKLSLLSAVMPENLVMLWLPNSVLLTALFHFRWRRYAYFATLIIAAEIAADYPTFSLIEAILFGAINLTEVTITYLLLRRWRFDPRITSPHDIAKFVMAGPVIGAFTSAFAGAAVYSYFRGTETSYFEFMRIWWFGDGMGLLIVTPLVLSLWPPATNVVRERLVPRWYDGIALIAAVLILSLFMLAHEAEFHGFIIRPPMLLPIAIYVAARFDVRTTIVAVTALAAVVLYVAKNGQHPFGDMPIRQTIISVQELIFVMSVTSLGLATLLAQLRNNTRELEARVRDRTAELSAANAQLETLAVTDPLTGILNRRALFDLMRREMNREQRHQRLLAVILFDVDHFKKVNDSHGHAAGDKVLRHAVAVTSNVIRSSDTMARYGGEEFVVVAPETDRASALYLAERMREALRSSTVAVNRDTLRVTASFGVAMLHADDKDPEQLLQRADRALYAAKAAGRDRVVAETITMEETAI